MQFNRIIGKNLRRNILIIIQLAIGMLILIRALSVYNYFREEVNSYRQSIKPNVYDIYLIPKDSGTVSGMVNNDSYGDVVSRERETYNLVKDDARVRVATFSNYSFGYRLSDYTEEKYFKIPKDIVSIRMFGTDRELFEMYENKIISGQGYKEYYQNNDNDEKVIPIWISDKLATYNKVGDIIEIPEFDLAQSNQKFKIIGVIDSRYPTLQKLQNGGIESSKEEDYFIIADSKLITDRKVMSGIYIQLQEGVDAKEFQKEMNSKFETIKLQMISLESKIDRFYSFSRWNIRYIYYGIIIGILTSLSIISIILNSIKKREREIGIKFALGARRINILLEVSFEIIMLFFIALLVSLPFIPLANLGTIQTTFRWWIIGVVIIMNLILIALCIFPICVRIFRMTPVKLINKGGR